MHRTDDNADKDDSAIDKDASDIDADDYVTMQTKTQTTDDNADNRI